MLSICHPRPSLGCCSTCRSLALADRSPLVAEVAQAITSRGGDAVDVQVDLERYSGAQDLVTRAVSRHGRIDVLINHVGGSIWTKPHEHYGDEEMAEVRRSLFPTRWCCRAALEPMIARGSGASVNVSSIATRSLWAGGDLG